MTDEEIGKQIYQDIAVENGEIPRRWEDINHRVRETYTLIVKSARRYLDTKVPPAPAPLVKPDASIHNEADRLLRFFAGLDLSRLPIADQREARERIYTMRRTLRPEKL